MARRKWSWACRVWRADASGEGDGEEGVVVVVVVAGWLDGLGEG